MQRSSYSKINLEVNHVKTLTSGLIGLTVLFNRDAASELALHFLDKMKIMVVKDIEREDIEFICKVIHRV